LIRELFKGVSMKRSVLVLILVLVAFFTAYGQNTPMDIILVLDTSSAMASSYENVSNYITGPFHSEFLRTGDTFHLVAFSDSPRLDIARRITSVGDVETIIGRMLIQYPVERGSNVSSAISFAEQYAASLPARPKKIVLVTTGGGDTNSLVSAARQRLSSGNATIDFVQVNPGQALSNLPSSGRSPATATTAASPSATPSPAVTTPAQQTQAPAAQQQTPSPSTTQQTQTTTPTQSTATPQQSAGTTEQTVPPPAGSTGAETGTAVRPADTSSSVSETAGTETGAVEQSGSAGQPAAVGTGTGVTGSEPREPVRETVTPSPLVPEQQRESSSSLASSMPLIIGLIILALIILGIIIFFATRKLGSSPNRVMAQAASSKPEPREDLTPFVDHSKDLAKYAAVQSKQRSTPYDNRPIKTEAAKPAVINPSGPLLLNLFVEDQNTAIGKRNIHSLKSGYSLSVGGGQSDFLIFLVPMPANIGEIRRNGSQCSFIPKKSKYFPDLGSNELRDCINKTIRVISDKNYELRFRFEMYEDPLVELNRVLMSVNVPG